jgi:flagellar basal-body rod protein FlgG
MLRGIYAAANAMRYRANQVDVTANNLANVTTDGFKRDRTALRSFNDLLAARINDQTAGPLDPARPVPIGRLDIGGCIAEAPFIDFSAGAPRVTGNPLDLFLGGPGFFALDTPRGVRYTRSGSFNLNDSGEIVNQEGFRLLGANGAPIRLTSPSPITIDSKGEISQDKIPVGRIGIVEFPDMTQIEKEGYTLFRPIDPNPPWRTPPQAISTSVEQGTVEMSNVNPIECMIELIVSQRAYEAAARAVDMFNQSMTQVSGELGRIPG